MKGRIQLWKKLRQLTDLSLSFIYPEICQLCEAQPAGPKEGYVCHPCRERAGGIRFIVPPFCDRCGLPFEGDITGDFECANCHDLKLHFLKSRSSVRTSNMILDVIHRYKYQRHLWFESLLVDLLEQVVRQQFDLSCIDLITPIPLHKTKKHKRGFNQAERLGKKLAKRLNVPFLPRTLERIRPTETQTRLTRKMRIQNVLNAFGPGIQINQVKNLRVLLIDDIMTTGATASACAKILKKHKASCITVTTISRGV
ncbi:ComF family protein [bacterium]|nr:ComF family protein [bacterium]